MSKSRAKTYVADNDGDSLEVRALRPVAESKPNHKRISELTSRSYEAGAAVIARTCRKSRKRPVVEGQVRPVIVSAHARRKLTFNVWAWPVDGGCQSRLGIHTAGQEHR